ncbi:alpha/beta fold hydrolase [Prauserella cavernicola]|uniref:Alpha/beta hydrolase n=1 Tax=Prauserella cavernicola TaxID=2800127 RepID=A0A934QRM7_9PSEU|nr:alpha/beta hydrolase [Prauserella cavernicola]MBK1784893.1 alpha/beta hydrolase [Prauserella cavernicola]
MRRIRFGYADTSLGQLHYAECGSGEPVVLLHQTPRSWDEYREVLPLLGATHRAIAMDTAGFGNSAPPAEHGIEHYAAAVLELLDALGLEKVSLVGHHTGGVVAIEVAASAPERVDRLVLSSTPWVDAASREARVDRPPIDHVPVSEDGSHLRTLWQRRQGFYPERRLDLLTRFVRDALTLGDDVEAGHHAVGRYRMEERAGEVRAPVLCLGASADPHTFPQLGALSSRFNAAEVVIVEGGMVPLMEEHAGEVVRVIARFLT